MQIPHLSSVVWGLGPKTWGSHLKTATWGLCSKIQRLGSCPAKGLSHGMTRMTTQAYLDPLTGRSIETILFSNAHQTWIEDIEAPATKRQSLSTPHKKGLRDHSNETIGAYQNTLQCYCKCLITVTLSEYFKSLHSDNQSTVDCQKLLFELQFN